MRIVAVADTHTFEADLGELPEGDLFIHAGDLLRGGELEELQGVAAWIAELPHRHKVIIADATTLRSLRDALAVFVAFATGSRPSSIVYLDLVIGISSSDAHGLVINRDYVKGSTDDRDDAKGKVSLTFPLTGIYARVRRALDVFSSLARRARSRAASSRLPYFFELDDVDSASTALSTWLANILRVCDIQPPAGIVYQPGSLRSGMASACTAIGIPRPRIEFLGGWVPGSSALTTHYIDPTMVADASAYAVFGHLVPALPAAVGAPEAVGGAPPSAD